MIVYIFIASAICLQIMSAISLKFYSEISLGISLAVSMIISSGMALWTIMVFITFFENSSVKKIVSYFRINLSNLLGKFHSKFFSAIPLETPLTIGNFSNNYFGNSYHNSFRCIFGNSFGFFFVIFFDNSFGNFQTIFCSMN